MWSFVSLVTFALVAVSSVAAQTTSACNPTKKTGCPANPALGKSTTIDFTSQSSAFVASGGGGITYGADGLSLTLNERGDAPTLTSSFYLFFGRIDVVAKAAPGQGIVSSIVMQSDDLDEIDWEWLGGDTTQVQSNYFGKGDATTYDRGAFHGVGTPQNSFHTYSLQSTSKAVTWSIDGTVVRTLNYADAQGGTRFPQTPMQVKIGIWAGGDPDNAPGTIEWAGGETDYTQAPFTMVVKSISLQDHTSGSSYTYGDQSGSWQSIQIN